MLSDADKRNLYDQYGEEGLEHGGMGGGADASDIFDMFFGGGGARRPRGPQKGDDVVSAMEWTLEQFFQGATKKMAVTRSVICAECKGKGGPEDAFTVCRECDGQGVRVVIRRMGPMISQSQSPCPSCKASGKVIAENKKCKECSGNGITKERNVLELVLPRGAPNNHKITFANEADEKPGEIAGDVIFICKEKAHPVYKRVGDDLFMTKVITLNEALTGCGFYIEHVDGTEKYVETSANEIVKPNDVLAVEGQGMPRNGSLFTRGNIYIKFEIKFPTSLNAEQAKSLKKLLPPPARVRVRPDESSELESFHLQHIDPTTTQNSSRNVHADDDEDGPNGGPQGVQCRQA